jgi:hypothetical protein
MVLLSTEVSFFSGSAGYETARRETVWNGLLVYGLEDEIYLALYTVWQDPADDERYRDWAGSNMASMSHLATCIALADENLGRRPGRFIADSNMARLDKVRSTYDPEGRFHSWMGRV